MSLDAEVIKGLLNVIEKKNVAQEATKSEVERTKALLEEAYTQNLLLTQENHTLKEQLGASADILAILTRLDKKVDNLEVNSKKATATSEEALLSISVNVEEIKTKLAGMELASQNPTSETEDETISGNDYEGEVGRRPWIAIPDLYEVACHNPYCGIFIPMSALRQDQVSVDCPSCSCATIVEQAEPGLSWAFFGRCDHFCLVNPQNETGFCGLCGLEGYHGVGYDAHVRVPVEKEQNLNMPAGFRL